mgnify:CR=1 FL=1
MFVNTDEVTSLAGNIDTSNNNITNALDNVTSAMNRLKGAWGGAAGEKAATLFNALNSGCIEVQRLAIADYANFLRQRVASGYEQVESANTALSDAFK